MQNLHRRRFLTTQLPAATLCVATAHQVGLAWQRRARAPVRERQQFAKKLELEFLPLIGSHEVVVLPGAKFVFVTFPATSGNVAGTGLLRFSDCLDWNLIGGRNRSRLDTDDLMPGEIYEIQNSNWAQSTGATHFVVTTLGLHDGIGNRGVNLEVLANRMHGEFLPETKYSEVIEYIQLFDDLL